MNDNAIDRAAATWDKMAEEMLELIKDNANTRSVAASCARHAKLALWAMLLVAIAHGLGTYMRDDDHRAAKRRETLSLVSEMRASEREQLRVMQRQMKHIETLANRPALVCPSVGKRRR